MEMKEKAFDESIGEEAMKDNHEHEEGVKIPIHDGKEEEALQEEEAAKREESAAGEDKKEEIEEDSDQELSREEAEEASSGESGPEEEEAEDSARADKGEKEKKTKKKKKKSQGALEIEIRKCKEKVEEYADRYQRLLAEFENARTRSAREQSHMYDAGAKDILAKLLPVVDNFERGIDGLSQEGKEDPFAQGVIKIYQQLMTTLEEVGVTPMNAKGKEFDPNVHNAISQQDGTDYASGYVCAVYQKGYKIGDKLIRPAMVAVAL